MLEQLLALYQGTEESYCEDPTLEEKNQMCVDMVWNCDCGDYSSID